MPDHDAQPHATRTGAPHALLTGGGSGGHVFPALAVADALAERGWQVSYAGAARGIEARLVPAHGLAFHALPARPLVGRGLVGKLGALTTLGRSAFAARALVRRLDARIVVGTGGYAAAPAMVGGWLARRPTLLVEPNARAGVANRALSRLARGAALAYPGTADELACPTTVTGIPVRRAFFDVPQALVNDTLLVLGGSQGAQQLNTLVPRALAALAADRRPRAVVHQCGSRHEADARAAYDEVALGDTAVQIVPFLDDVASAMAGCGLVVSRAGAITLAELCAAGRPAVLVPLDLAGGHQRDNAEGLARAGAAQVLPGDGAADALAELLGTLLGSPARLDTMAAAARALGRADAAQAIADQVETLTGEAR